jgi:putative methylase
MISKSGLAIELSRLRVFSKPMAKLEQYPTDSEIAASVLWNAYLKGWIKDKKIVDLGAGSGILGIGALLLDAKGVLFVENDPEIINTFKANIEERDLVSRSRIIQADVEEIKGKKADSVIQNPPFGTRNKSIDIKFLKKAFEIAPKVISFHKTSTIEYVKGKCRQAGFELVEEMELLFPLKNTLSFHKKRIQRIEVSCLFLAKSI